MYPNFENQRSFSTNHVERGEHVKRNSFQRKQNFSVPLLKYGDERKINRILKSNDFCEIPVLDSLGISWNTGATMVTELQEINSMWENHDATAVVRDGIDVLRDTSVLDSRKGQLLESRIPANSSTEKKHPFTYHAIIQSDGQFVIYRSRRVETLDEKEVSPIWNANTFQGRAKIGIHYTVRLNVTGSLIVEEVDVTNSTRRLQK